MNYPKELEFTELEEQYLLDKLDYTSLDKTINDVIYAIGDETLTSYDNVWDLESCIRDEFSSAALQFSINAPMAEEIDVLRLKLETRKVYRRKYKQPVSTAVWIIVGNHSYACTKDPIVLGDYYYRPSLREVFRGSGWQEGDYKVVSSTDFEVLRNL